jgi:hypothetical protein
MGGRGARVCSTLSRTVGRLARALPSAPWRPGAWSCQAWASVPRYSSMTFGSVSRLWPVPV